MRTPLAPKPSRFAVGQEIKDRSLMRPRELVVAWVEAFNRGDPAEMATSPTLLPPPLAGEVVGWGSRQSSGRSGAGGGTRGDTRNVRQRLCRRQDGLHRRAYFRGWPVGNSRVERSARAARTRFPLSSIEIARVFAFLASVRTPQRHERVSRRSSDAVIHKLFRRPGTNASELVRACCN